MTVVVWHDVECGAYGADLPLWEELAATAAPDASSARVLELGCGSGRVALHLAARGHRLTGVDVDADLVAALAERADGRGLPVDALTADARELRLDRRFDLVIAPMQLVQLLGERGRRQLLGVVAAHVSARGLAALAVMEGPPAPWRAGPDSPAPPPDVREQEGWIYSSLPVGIDVDGGEIAIRRLRQTVSPTGGLVESEDLIRLNDLSAEGLEAEARAAGLRPRERRAVTATGDHLGSIVVVFEVER